MDHYITYGNDSNNSISGIINGNISGGDAVDIMYGFGGNDTLSGKNGDDILYGGDGDDTLNGDAGNDTLYGGSGNDTLNGGGGDDLFVYEEGLDLVKDIHGGNDTLLISSGVVIDQLSFSNGSGYSTVITIDSGVNEITVDYLRHGNANYLIENITFDDGFTTDLTSYDSWVWGTGSNNIIAYAAADDIIIGAGGDDILQGNGGNDDIHGGSGDDILEGGDGDDQLHGGTGNDTLYGGDGLDILFGGAGADTFVFESASAFNNVDIIKDFSTSENDVLDISDILTSYDPMSDVLTDFVQITDDGTDSFVAIDADGGADNFVQIATIESVTGLTDEAALYSAGTLVI